MKKKQRKIDSLDEDILPDFLLIILLKIQCKYQWWMLGQNSIFIHIRTT